MTRAEFHRDPSRAIDWMHSHAPTYWYDPRPDYHTPFWILAKSADIRAVAADAATWCSSEGTVEPFATVDWDPLLEMLDFFDAELDRRMSDPRDDYISAVAHGTFEGRGLDRNEMLMMCWGFLVGGAETTNSFLGGGVRALMDNPDQKTLLLDPANVQTAVSELLRWTTPTRALMRTATRVIGT
ncbi:cytochrome P450 [Nocardioides humi]|uniref:Cytochrome P450 n=1 Tax=Nocardioides humi TaxID=449461 RepID=A0ABN2A3X8_9ACTN|nr:cytochrome P450 [Nocardioides humi]